MLKEREDLIKGLKKQIIEDICLFVKGNSVLTADEMKEACMVVEAIGCTFKNEVVQNIKKCVIDPYEEIFK